MAMSNNQRIIIYIYILGYTICNVHYIGIYCILSGVYSECIYIYISYTYSNHHQHRQKSWTNIMHTILETLCYLF